MNCSREGLDGCGGIGGGEEKFPDWELLSSGGRKKERKGERGGGRLDSVLGDLERDEEIGRLRGGLERWRC